MEKKKKPNLRQFFDTIDFKFDWEGGLEELKDKFSSVELQHKINEIRVKKYLKKK